MANLQLAATLELIDKISQPLKQITQGSKGLQNALETSQAALKKLQQQQGAINTFNTLSESVKKSSVQLNEAQQKADKLAQAFEQASNPTKKMAQQLEKAKQNVEKFKQKNQEQVEVLNKVQHELKESGIDTNHLADAQNKLSAKIKLANQAVSAQQDKINKLNAAQQKYQNTQQKLDTIKNKGINAGYAATAIGTGAFALPIKSFAEAEDAATTLKVSMMQANGQVATEFAHINQLANKLGTQLPGTTADFQNMMAKLVQQGISYKAILGGVGEASGYLAVQLKMPFEQAAEFAAKMQDATKTQEKDMLALMDTIQRSYYLGVDSTNMLSGFSKISAGMKTIKMEGLAGAKAMAPLLIMADQAAMAGESAGNAYSKIFKSMMDTGKIAKTLKGTGLNMNFTNGKGEFGGMDNMFKQLEKLKGLSTEKRLPILSDMFGDDAETIQALNLLIDKGQAGYNETIDKMNAQADLQKRVNEQLGTLNNLWDAASGTFTSAMANFGAAIAPELKSVVTWLTNMTEKLGAWSQRNPELSNTIMKVIAGLVLLLAAFSAVSFVVVTVLGPMALLRLTLSTLGAKGLGIVSVFKMIGNAVLWLGKAFLIAGRFMLANPIILAITLLATVAYLIYRNWQPIKQFFIDLWNTISNSQAFIALGDAIGGTIAFLNGLWQSAVNAVSQFFGTVATLASGLVSSLTGYWQTIVATLSGAWNNIVTVTQSTWQMIVQFFSGGIANLVLIIQSFSPLVYLQQAFASVMNYLGVELPAKFMAFGGMIMQGLANGIANAAGTVVEKAKAVAANVSGSVKSAFGINSPSRLFAQFGQYNMQGLAQGMDGSAALPIQSAIRVSQGLLAQMQPLQASGTMTTPMMDTRPPLQANPLQANTALSAQPISQTFHIHASEGMDEQKLAQLVAKEVQKAQYQQQANQRRNYSDIN